MLHPLGGGPPAEMAAQIAHELSALAADARTLASLLAPGDVVAATVLPSNGLTDLLDVGGLRVAAALPPSLVPGEHISVMVTGFDGDRINLQIVPPPADAPAPPPSRRPSTPPVAPAGSPSLSRAAQISPAPAGPPVPSVPPLRGSAVAQPSDGSRTLEARLAAANAAPPSSATAPPVRSAALNANVRPAIAGPPGRLQPPPRIAARPPIAPRPNRPPLAARGAPEGQPPAARGIAAFREPTVLLRGLGLPVTPANLAAARSALDAPTKLAGTLAARDRALSARGTPQTATLRTLTSFLSPLDVRSPVFGTQIAAFVDHVVTGREVKLGQLLQSADAAATPAADGREEGSPHAPMPRLERRISAPALAAARAAVVRTGLDFDLKTQLLGAAERGAAASAPESNADALNRAVIGALTAITAVQLHAAAALGANPDSFAFALPIALPGAVAQAHVRINRDAPGVKPAPLDGDNFQIAFVLETRHLGTVAIEMTTVGRAVTLSVKTEAATAARAFGSALPTLNVRLESLRYRIAKADAVVAPPAPLAPPEPAAHALPVRDSARLVDLDA